ncbi:DUF5719 family protein [Arthrobacter sp. ok362]|uniref:DUF5719 family protein n=1 Tax=Arthrobacter sp. ok362 TaxID=1761745 RepID=UPI0008841876|nr:DUF5719 family protein [Arthrobacter sp. ok362]SDK40806.1 hypothetical protein SAMN04487913_101135 [Arthrobacter sp. ok362]
MSKGEYDNENKSENKNASGLVPETSAGASSMTEAPAAGVSDAGAAAKDASGAGATPRKRGVPRAGVIGGILTAVALVAACGGLVSAASLTPQSPASRHLEAPVASVPAGSSVGVCPGPARLLEGTPVGTDPQFSPESATAKTAVSAAVLGSSAGVIPGSRLAPLKGAPLAEIAKGAAAAPTASAAAATASAAAATASAAAPRTPVLIAGVVPQREVDNISVLSADAQDNRQAAAGAVLSYTAEDGDLQGSATAACQQPGNDLWLVGANTALGRSAVLNLTNASSTPATVSLDLLGSEGLIQAPGSRGLLVAPGSTRSIVLAGLAPGQERLGVRVRSTGGPVAAVIQQSVLRGLTPGGVDFITPGTAPSVSQVAAGLEIQAPAALAALTAKPGFADAGPALEVAVPGAADAVVEIKLYGRDGQKALPGGGVVTAKAGAVTEVSLAGVPAGTYTVAASSDVSFAATARLTRGLQSGDAADIAFSAASARLGSQHIVPVPRTGDRQLVFGAPEGRATVSYTPITADGKIRTAGTADIAGGTTVSIKIPADVGGSPLVGYVVSAAGDPAYGALVLGRDGRQDISAVAVAPEAAGQRQVPVTLGY